MSGLPEVAHTFAGQAGLEVHRATLPNPCFRRAGYGFLAATIALRPAAPVKPFLLFLLAVCLIASPAVHAADGALVFTPASQQRVEVKNFAGLGITNEVTVEFWALSTRNDIAQSVFMLNPDTPTNRFQSHLNYFNGNTYWDFGDIGQGGRVSVPNQGTWLNNWTHFALVGSQRGGFMKIYANGTLVATSEGFNDLDLGVLARQDAKLSIGGILGTYFEGKIDDFRI